MTRTKSAAGQCRSCGKAIIWAKTEAGKLTPVDAKPVGLARLEGDAHEQRIVGVTEGYVSHFSTCPQSKDWRKSR